MSREMDSRAVLEATGRVIKEHKAEVQREIARTDRGFNLIATVEALHIEESLNGLRQWVQRVAYEKSHVLEVRANAPAWLVALDAKGGAK